MKKHWLAAGPVVSLIAFKCPLCFVALAGVSVGLGSMLPMLNTVYWLVILGLGGVFLWTLYQSWRRDAAPTAALAVGVAGFISLVIQIAFHLEHRIGIVSALLLVSAAALTLNHKKAKGPGCGCATTIDALPYLYPDEDPKKV